jgi:hypothetical protein
VTWIPISSKFLTYSLSGFKCYIISAPTEPVVDELLWSINEHLQKKYQLKAQGLDVDKIAERVAARLGLPVQAVRAAGKLRKTVESRSLLCHWSPGDWGFLRSPSAARPQGERNWPRKMDISFQLNVEMLRV